MRFVHFTRKQKMNLYIAPRGWYVGRRTRKQRQQARRSKGVWIWCGEFWTAPTADPVS
jgi:hypothetical protein